MTLPPIWETKQVAWVEMILEQCKYWEYPYGGPDNIAAMVNSDKYTFYQGHQAGFALEWCAPRTYRMMTFLPAGTDEAWIVDAYAQLVKYAKAAPKRATRLIAYASWADMTPAEVLRLFKMKPTTDVLHFKGVPLVVYQRTL